jgi:phytoene dehydrogenase-like protein
MKIAIIGSGISGLFSGLMIKNNFKNVDIVIFEKNKKIGGRIEMANFEGQKVIAGAGIGRKNDKLLYDLCNKLNVTINEYHADFEHTSKPIDIVKVLSHLKENFHNLIRNKENFKEFATKILGKEIYAKFTFSIGETDYEKADVVDTIFDYGFENYTFEENNGTTIITVDLDTIEDFVDYMTESYPSALKKLKEICEK